MGVQIDIAGSTPLLLFILQSQRTLFAATYQFDKSIATFLGRPPRILWRHSDCYLLLDIGDHILEGDQKVLEAAQIFFDADEWNNKQIY